jgi:hypothetical protein
MVPKMRTTSFEKTRDQDPYRNVFAQSAGDIQFLIDPSSLKVVVRASSREFAKLHATLRMYLCNDRWCTCRVGILKTR